MYKLCLDLLKKNININIRKSEIPNNIDNVINRVKICDDIRAYNFIIHLGCNDNYDILDLSRLMYKVKEKYQIEYSDCKDFDVYFEYTDFYMKIFVHNIKNISDLVNKSYIMYDRFIRILNDIDKNAIILTKMKLNIFTDNDTQYTHGEFSYDPEHISLIPLVDEFDKIETDKSKGIISFMLSFDYKYRYLAPLLFCIFKIFKYNEAILPNNTNFNLNMDVNVEIDISKDVSKKSFIISIISGDMNNKNIDNYIYNIKYKIISEFPYIKLYNLYYLVNTEDFYNFCKEIDILLDKNKSYYNYMEEFKYLDFNNIIEDLFSTCKVNTIHVVYNPNLHSIDDFINQNRKYIKNK